MKIRPRNSTVWWIQPLPRAGRVRVSFDNEGTVRVRPICPRRPRVLGAERLRTPGYALGGLNLGMVVWDPEVTEHVTLTRTERESIEARVESALRHVVDSRWFRYAGAGW